MHMKRMLSILWNHQDDEPGLCFLDALLFIRGLLGLLEAELAPGEKSAVALPAASFAAAS